MSPKFVNNFLVGYHRRSARRRQSGFTLIELLVAIIIGALIVSTMLALVLELLKVSQREEVLTQTQQDMRRALDYMATDVTEADYVYSTPAQLTAVTGQLTTDPAWPAGATPVIAFWRLDPIDMADLPANPGTYNAADPDGCVGEFGANTTKAAECSALKIRQSAPSLVIYLQVANDGTTVWDGPSRIIRYELPKYSDVTTLTQTPGYDDPTVDDPAVDDEGFADWVVVSGTPAGNVAVLTDHVTAVDGDATLCPGDTGDPTVDPYTRLPATSDSFYICARTGDDADAAGVRIGGSNQSLIVYLTGDVNNEPSTFATNDASKLPTIQSEVLVRGVIEKRVDN
ncbi:MAG: type II secretion system protein [Cyanobacteria bacterium P01_H01_bin.162]